MKMSRSIFVAMILGIVAVGAAKAELTGYWNRYIGSHGTLWMAVGPDGQETGSYRFCAAGICVGCYNGASCNAPNSPTNQGWDWEFVGREGRPLPSPISLYDVEGGTVDGADDNGGNSCPRSAQPGIGC